MFKKTFHILLTLVLALLLPFSISAKEITVSASYKYQFFNNEARESAIKEAKESAWKKYMINFSVARKSIYRSNKQEFLNALNELIVEETVVQEKNDESRKLLRISLRVVIDDNAVTAMFNDLSAGGNQATGESSNFGSVFVARKKMNAKAFDTKRVSINETEAEDNLSQDVASENGRSTQATSIDSFSRTATGGSTTKKRTEVSWELDETAQEYLSSAINEALVNAGFEPMDYNDLTDQGAPYADELFNEVTDKGTIRGDSMKKIKDAAIDSEWQYFGYGTVDLDLPQTDPATGLFKVSAIVAYKVMMFKDSKSKTVATVRATQVYGLSETEDAATNEALNKAASIAVNTVVDQLQKKAIR